MKPSNSYRWDDAAARLSPLAEAALERGPGHLVGFERINNKYSVLSILTKEVLMVISVLHA